MLVLDPYVLAELPGESSEVRVARVTKKLKDLIRLCRDKNLKVVVDADGWTYLERQVISTLKPPPGNPELATSLSVLRRSYLDRRTPFLLSGGRTWGISPLFGGLANAKDTIFGNFVARSVGHAMQSGADAAYLFVELKVGRNLLEHGAQPSTILERTRWRIYVAYSGHPVAAVSCITGQRNIAVPWTCRFDDLLPDTGTYAFLPPDHWQLKGTTVVATQNSKAVWLDRLGNGWARPSTPPPGLPEHWDVYLQPEWRSKLKLSQVNITRFGINDSERLPGEIHHVPTEKAHILKA